MNFKNSSNKELMLYVVMLILFLWMALTNSVPAFKCPKMTQTELFLHLPKTAILNFNNCD